MLAKGHAVIKQKEVARGKQVSIVQDLRFMAVSVSLQ